MQALYVLALLPVAETTADLNSYGFRPKRSTAEAIEQCFTVLARKISPPWVLEGDIRGCFDNISHAWMLDHIPTDKEVLRKWLKAGYMENRALFSTEAGTPQGGIIPPTLANLTLDGLERLLKKTFRRREIGGKRYNLMVNFVRCADDLIITGCPNGLLENEVKPLVERFMLERGLQLSPALESRHETGALDRAAQNGYPCLGLLSPPHRSGFDVWKVKNDLWHLLWRWAKRRHPNKNSAWIVN